MLYLMVFEIWDLVSLQPYSRHASYFYLSIQQHLLHTVYIYYQPLGIWAWGHAPVTLALGRQW